MGALTLAALALLAAACGGGHQNTPISSTTEAALKLGSDREVLLEAAAEVRVQQVSASADFINQLHIEGQDIRHSFTCSEDGVGIEIESVPAGEITLSLTTSQGYRYFTGPASRNPDGKVHARIEQLMPSRLQIVWEDYFGGGDEDFNDCVVILNVRS
ncbi:MAG TPA: DUF4114 domain-containing protein [Dehalococcoidia bacterium]|nr:DUF4114 domain-containing protein [Dehalococcoidia bacterium]